MRVDEQRVLQTRSHADRLLRDWQPGELWGSFGPVAALRFMP
jgi:hypothetical protein